MKEKLRLYKEEENLMKLKSIFSLLLVLIMIFSAVPTFAQESLTADSRNISRSYQEESPEKAERLAEALVNPSEFMLGEERVFHTDSEHTLSITLTAIEEPTITAFASSVNTPTYTWTITDTIIFGVQYTVFVAKLYANYVPDGWNGYISALYGSLRSINSSWTVKWDDDFNKAALHCHTLGVQLTKGASTGYVIFTADYDPFNSTCKITKNAF